MYRPNAKKVLACQGAVAKCKRERLVLGMALGLVQGLVLGLALVLVDTRM